MAIPKKGTRKITVNESDYRWLIRKKVTYTQSVYGDGKLSVAIELAENPGTTLHIYTDRNHPHDIYTKEVTPIVPSDISNWINKALLLGWKPSEKGKPFHAEIENGQMKIAV
ncbi:hypothetical protein [Kordia sp.]|uniref:hypothetical protein n=1 Tax=Kordia sp. TaxID=1965332 RepID=UPI003D6BDCF1